MAQILKFPIRFRPKNLLKGKDVKSELEPTDEEVWALCPYIRRDGDTVCYRCPKYEPNEPEDEPGLIKRKGCRINGEFVARAASAARRKFGEPD